MKIKDYIYFVVIGVLAVLLSLCKCGRNKCEDTTPYLHIIDSLNTNIKELTKVRKDSIVYDTVVKTKTITLEKKVPVLINVPVYIENEDSIRVYTYASAKESIVVTDTLQVKGEILSHKSTIHITEPCDSVTIYKYFPIVVKDTVKIHTSKVPAFQLRAGVMTDIHNPESVHGMLSFDFRKGSLFSSHNISTNEWFVGVKVPILTIKGKTN